MEFCTSCGYRSDICRCFLSNQSHPYYAQPSSNFSFDDHDKSEDPWSDLDLDLDLDHDNYNYKYGMTTMRNENLWDKISVNRSKDHEIPDPKIINFIRRYHELFGKK
jgi:hypothetical protein